MNLGHGKIILAKGKDNIIMRTRQGTKRLSNVLYVLRLSQNLINIAQLLPNKIYVCSKDQVCVIYDLQGAEFVRVKMVKNVFVLSDDSLLHHASNTRLEESKM